MKNNFQYILNYDYDCYVCDYDNCGCKDGSDYCRSAHYEGLKVKDINIEILLKHFLEYYQNKYEDYTFIPYCIDRLIRIYKMYDSNNWEVTTCSGYYGDEIDEIKFCNFDKLINDIENLIYISPSDRIRFILNKEYGSILPRLLKKEFIELKVEKTKLFCPNEFYAKKITDNIYKSEGILINLPIGIYQFKNKKHYLIDGYHRFISLTDLDKKVKIITTK